MNKSPEPHEVLGISANASLAEIEAAFQGKLAAREEGSSWELRTLKAAREQMLHDLSNDQPDELRLAPIEVAPEPSPSEKHRSQSVVENSVSANESRLEKSRLAAKANTNRILKGWFYQQLPLQNETTYFILANVLDIFMTYILLNTGAIEANPIANWILKQGGFTAMIAYKLAIVAIVCVIAQILATRRMNYARGVLWVGTGIVTLVVIYSVRLIVSSIFYADWYPGY